MEDDTILIRPDPDNMALSVPGRRAVAGVGAQAPGASSCWCATSRSAPPSSSGANAGGSARLPKTPDEMKQMIAASQIAIRGSELYYYSKATGTRLLTCEAFCATRRPGRGGPAAAPGGNPRVLRRRQPPRAARRSPSSWPATASRRPISPPTTSPPSTPRRSGPSTRRCGRSSATPSRPSSATTTSANLEWRNAMYAALIGEDEKAISEESLLGLSSEFFMQIEWLPGGRIEEGELIFDSVFDLAEETERPRTAAAVRREVPRVHLQLRPRVRRPGVRQHRPGGRLAVAPGRNRRAAATSTSPRSSSTASRTRSSRSSACRSGASASTSTTARRLLDAIIQSEEYTEYILDRRLGCRQLGMNLPAAHHRQADQRAVSRAAPRPVQRA